MLDVFGAVLVGLAAATVLVGTVTTMPIRLPGRLVLASLAGGWIGFAGAVAGSGGLSNPVALLAMFGAPLIATTALVRFIPTARHTLATVPLSLLVGLNAVRIGGVLFVLLAVAGRLSGPFPYIAGWGDFLTGAGAALLVWPAAGGAGMRKPLLTAWNTFGMLDLVVAVALGVTSRNGSPLQLIHAGVGTGTILTLPWAFVPTVLVPFFLIVHASIFVRLRAQATATLDQRRNVSGKIGHAY